MRKAKAEPEEGQGFEGNPSMGKVVHSTRMTQQENDKQMQTYSLGDTIRVEFDLRDQSGVLTVNATFYETKSGHSFSIRGDGGGRAEVTVVLTEEVTDKILPGEYRCKDVTVYNTHYNYTTFAPEIRFRVENYPGNHQGPKLEGWRVSKQ